MKKDEAKKTGPELLREQLSKNGSKGGKTTLTKYGHNHYSKIGERGGASTKELWQKIRKSRRPSTNRGSQT